MAKIDLKIKNPALLKKIPLKKSPAGKKSAAKNRNKFILSIGDDGAILTYLSGNQVLRRSFAASTAPDQSIAVAELFASDTKAPISILLDTQDQTFTTQNLPPVSPVAIQKLANRRLERDFPPDDLKGSIQVGRTSDAKKEWIYLFCAVPSVGALSEWLNYVLALDNHFGGMHLLPIEAPESITALSNAVRGIVPKKKDAHKPEWLIFLSHNKIGGFRQIVLRNGKFVLTRITQSETDDSPESVAGSIEQELISTKEYLKRIGYSEAAEIGVIIICSEDIKRYVDSNKIRATYTDVMTPYDACIFMGYAEACEKNDRYGDVFLSTAIFSRSKRMLGLQTPQTLKLKQTYSMLLGIRAAAGVISPLILLAIAMNIYSAISLSIEISDIVASSNREKIALKDLKEVDSKLPEEVDKIINIVQLNELLTAKSFTPVQIIEPLAKQTSEDAFVTNFEWQSKEIISAQANSNNAPPPSTPATPDIQSSAKVQFRNYKNDNSILAERVSTMTSNLKDALAGFEISNSKLPGEYTEKDIVEVNLDQSTTASAVKVENKVIDVDIKFLYTKQAPKLDAPAAATAAPPGMGAHP